MRERITIIIETGNAAFDDEPANEIGRILHTLARKYYRGDLIEDARLFDVNGNACGRVTVATIGAEA